jgi:cephalosporin-C deacetylase-like acetyl esterase
VARQFFNNENSSAVASPNNWKAFPLQLLRICAIFVAITLPTLVLAQRVPNAVTREEAQAQTDAALNQLVPYLNTIGFKQLRDRDKVINKITSRADAERRRESVRHRIADLVGGIPTATGPVAMKLFGSVEEENFRIENIAYESIPGYWVTANVYVPRGSGPFPAIVMVPGHGAGKSSNFAWAATLVKAGMLVLSIDPLGQGERMQHFDPELGNSKVEPSGEHEHANQSALLVGQHIARYWFADGKRGVDYLVKRADVDANHIGTFGCSGGGTAAAYLAAMDDRIAVAAVSSFITAFEELLPGNGPQDAEQTLPAFIAQGFNFADWVELAAPRPYAVIAFEQDFFPIAGAKRTYDEAKRFYSLYNAADQIQLIAAPGGHCNLKAVSSQVLTFLTTHLKGPDAPIPVFEQLRPKNADALIVMPTGQVSTSINSQTAEGFARSAHEITGHHPTVIESLEQLATHSKQVQADIRQYTGVSTLPTKAPSVTTGSPQQHDGYSSNYISLETEPGITLNSVLTTPNGNDVYPTETWPALIWMEATPLDRIMASAEFQRLAKSNVILALHPRGVLGEPDQQPERLALGQYMSLSLRAMIVGKTLIGMRTDDILRATTWLITQPKVDSKQLTLYGNAALGMVALHAAALDQRITNVVVERTLISYEQALQAGLHRNLSESLIPDVLHHYDTTDLLIAISPRSMMIIDPVNPMGQRLRDSVARSALNPAFETNRVLGLNSLKLMTRGLGDPLPIQ